jgi:hypothetical protein
VIRRWLLVAWLMAGTVLMLLPTPSAEAFQGRPKWRGYFWNNLDTMGNSVLLGGISTTTADSFINKIVTDSNGPVGENRTGGEFIILTMMGYAAGAAGPSVAHDPAVVNDWANRVHYYDSQGWVNWNDFQAANENTYWQGDMGGGPETNDDAWFTEAVSGPAITFHRPGGGFYILRKACANPLGTLSGLDIPDYNVSMAIDDNSSAPGLKVVAGKQYRIGVLAHNNGPADSEEGFTEVMYPGAAKVVQPCNPAPVCNDPNQSGVIFSPEGAQGHGFDANSRIPGPVGTNWYWHTTPLGVGWNAGGVITWTVAPTAAPGTTITFTGYHWKGNRAGALSGPASITFTVVSERSPGVVGNNSDVNAGGGVCRGASTSGIVKGYPGSSSKGEYIVSASGSIADFKSNGNGADSLRLGQAGGYGPTCRPDLLQAAVDYRTGPGWNTIGVSGGASDDFNVQDKEGVYFYDGPDLRIHGTVNKKLTIVATTGKVTIIPPGVAIPPATSYTRANLPSLGVIAKDNIEILAAVTKVDAYLFSNGTIDTCVENNVACASPTLFVNGFLMGKDIAFHRLGPFNSNGSQVAEHVELNPQIYLNPPKLFDASVDDLLLEGQGERQPLF